MFTYAHCHALALLELGGVMNLSEMSVTTLIINTGLFRKQENNSQMQETGGFG